MKKSLTKILCLSLLISLFTACGSSQGQSQSQNQQSQSKSQGQSQDQSQGQSQSQTSSEGPDTTVDKFLQALQKQDYADAKSYYSENLDNMAQFRNQVEDISPGVATKLFSKLADFTYEINKVTIDPNNSDKAVVSTTITAYDLGKSFEATVLDYIKKDIEMTFDGSKSDDIEKEADSVIAQEIENATTTFSTKVDIKLTKEQDTWKLDKISDNSSLLNSLSGNIVDSINKLSSTLESQG